MPTLKNVATYELRIGPGYPGGAEAWLAPGVSLAFQPGEEKTVFESDFERSKGLQEFYAAHLLTITDPHAEPSDVLPAPNPEIAKTLESATTLIDVAAAAAPTAGQVLTATGPAAAVWSSPGGGGSWAVVFDETITGSAQHFTPITGLSLATDRIYKMYLTIQSAGPNATYVEIDINGDTTTNNYTGHGMYLAPGSPQSFNNYSNAHNVIPLSLGQPPLAGYFESTFMAGPGGIWIQTHSGMTGGVGPQQALGQQVVVYSVPGDMTSLVVKKPAAGWGPLAAYNVGSRLILTKLGS